MTEAVHLAAFDPVAGTWSKLGQWPGHYVHAIATMPNGDLVAAGAVRPDGQRPHRET
jgi:hypothetical protein